tara:strand:+ start:1883 stop:2653 length:771 start_codon:yes stop_codon:yes gene_type:complete
MGIDLNKMREKLASLKGKGSKSDSKFWRPQDGTQTIRIAPTPDGDPFKDMWFHYNVEQAGFLCPKRNFNESCPVCEFASQLWREGVDKNDEESKKLAKQLFVRQRFFSPVLVRGEEESGIRVWSYGKNAYESLLALVLNPEYGDITDVDAGTDLGLTYGKPSGASYPVTKLVPRRSSSALCEDMDPDKCAELLEAIPDFGTLYPRMAPEEVQTKLDAFMNSQVTDAEGDSSETQKYGNSTNSETDAVDKAFQELAG